MAANLSLLQSPAAIQAALNEFHQLGRTAFLAKYGFTKSREYLVRNPRTEELCDSKAVIGVAYGFQLPEHGPLKPSDFSGGEATVVTKLQSLGFEVVRIGEDWSVCEVEATVAAYFDMLSREARQERYVKSSFNDDLRKRLNGRSKASVELKHQNISAVLRDLGLPFIPGYKPRGNSQLLLRQEVQRFVLANADRVSRVIDALQDAQPPGEQRFQAVLVNPPEGQIVTKVDHRSPRVRLPRKVDFAARDEANRRLGRAGEQWTINYEQHRLTQAGRPELFCRLEWVSDKLGDGTGFDILSYDAPDRPRYIEVKTTNGPHASAFIISRNELEFSRETGDAFFLYRVFSFREAPGLYMLQGDVSKQVHLEPLDYRASFRRIASS